MTNFQVTTEKPLAHTLEQAERRYLEKLMTEVGGSKYAAAQRAGISYNRLVRRLDFHQIKPTFVARGR
ncbi:DNA-binding NtrC family response regulator [Roseovarius sp. MBR-154]|jgi:DNA-binding NtrC family response regulator